MLLVNVVLTQLAPVLISRYSSSSFAGPGTCELADRLMRLAERTDAHVRGVFKFDMSRRTKAANAAVVGLGNTRRIILGDTLLQEFTQTRSKPCWHTSWATTFTGTFHWHCVESVVTLAGCGSHRWG